MEFSAMPTIQCYCCISLSHVMCIEETAQCLGTSFPHARAERVCRVRKFDVTGATLQRLLLSTAFRDCAGFISTCIWRILLVSQSSSKDFGCTRRSCYTGITRKARGCEASRPIELRSTHAPAEDALSCDCTRARTMRRKTLTSPHVRRTDCLSREQ